MDDIEQLELEIDELEPVPEELPQDDESDVKRPVLGGRNPEPTEE